MKNIITLEIMWTNPELFTLIVKTEDNGTVALKAKYYDNFNETKSGFDFTYIKNRLAYEKHTKQTEEFVEFLKNFDGSLVEFSKTNATRLSFCNYNIYKITLFYKENEVTKSKPIGDDIYSESEAIETIMLEVNDNPNGWLEDNQKFLDFGYVLEKENVSKY